MRDRADLYKNHFIIDQDVARRAVQAYVSGEASSVVAERLGISSKTVLDYVRLAGNHTARATLQNPRSRSYGSHRGRVRTG